MSVRAVSRPSWLPAMQPPRPRVLAGLVVAGILLIAGWFWLRDSPIAEVRTVEVTGVAGAQGARIRAALEDAARSMTTLHVRHDALETSVGGFSLVKRLEVETDFPHTMRIHVVTNVAVGAIVVDGRRIAVTSDGTLLRDTVAAKRLPRIPVAVAPGGARLTERRALAAVGALGAAPEALRARVQAVTTTAEHGLEIQIAHGPMLYFGEPDRLEAKWAAAAAVLADPEAAGAHTIDVTVPERPAVTGVEEGATTTGESDVPQAPVGTETETTTTAPTTTETTPTSP